VQPTAQAHAAQSISESPTSARLSTAATCLHCTYVLRGLPTNGRCPACRTPYSPSARLGPGAACPQCTYRLEGLPPTGRCPECGSDYPPFGGSLRTPPLPAARQVKDLGWPAVVIVLGVGILLISKIKGVAPIGDVGRVLLVLGALLAWINGLVNGAYLCSHHAPIGRSVGNPLAHLEGPARLAVVGAFVAPLLLSILAWALFRAF
jgi:hypothetical protein